MNAFLLERRRATFPIGTTCFINYRIAATLGLFSFEKLVLPRYSSPSAVERLLRSRFPTSQGWLAGSSSSFCVRFDEDRDNQSASCASKQQLQGTTERCVFGSRLRALHDCRLELQ
jgi:hypothetical protein